MYFSITRLESDLSTCDLDFQSKDFRHRLDLDSRREIIFFRFRQKIKNEQSLVSQYLICHVSWVILSGNFSVLTENYSERRETKVMPGPGNNLPASDNNYHQLKQNNKLEKLKITNNCFFSVFFTVIKLIIELQKRYWHRNTILQIVTVNFIRVFATHKHQ